MDYQHAQSLHPHYTASNALNDIIFFSGTLDPLSTLSVWFFFRSLAFLLDFAIPHFGLFGVLTCSMQ